jgi:antibiotic biosynthesis monooxygenase (ABM) superfamily enzyme
MTGPNSQAASAPRPWLAKLAMNIGAWFVAWVTVFGLLSLFGDQLRSLPLAVRALVISGVLVALMANLVMPLLRHLVERWIVGSLR